jgi:hypothetical protein
MNEGVALARGAVVEPHRQQAAAPNMLRPAVATAGAELPVQVGGRLRQPHVVGVQHRPPGRGIPQAVQDGDALGRAQHQVKAGDGVAAVLAAEQLPVLGSRPWMSRRNPSLEASPSRPRLAEPRPYRPAWGLAVAGQVLLAVVGEPAQVVVLAASGELGHVQHHPRPPPAPRCASERTLVHCSPARK